MSLGKIIMVMGGARSGKSDWSEKLAMALSDNVVYVATAGIHDEEMADRVKKHRERRPTSWQTIEETHKLSDVLMSVHTGDVVLIDCLTLWISNLMLDELVPRQGATDDEKEEYILKEVKRLVSTARNNKIKLIMVSNEVGLGLVPDNKLGRLYRDIAGKVNQEVAKHADRVFVVMAGIPVDIKSMAVNIMREEI